MFGKLKRISVILRAYGIRYVFLKIFEIWKYEGLGVLAMKIKRSFTSKINRAYIRVSPPRLSSDDKRWLQNIEDRALRLGGVEIIPNIAQLKTAIHIHLYYPALINEFFQRLHELRSLHIDIFITIVDKDAEAFVVEMAKNYGIDSVSVILVPNRGRDLGPLFTKLAWLFDKYDYICHVHTKRSPHTHFGEKWRTYLLDNLIGQKQRVEQILSYLESHPECAILYPLNYPDIQVFTCLEGNNTKIKELLRNLGLGEPLRADFPAGSMSWMKTKAYRPFVGKLPAIENYEHSTGQIDGTYAHALERLLTQIPLKSGSEINCYLPINKGHFSLENIDEMPKFDFWHRECSEIALQVNALPLAKFAQQKFNSDSLNIHWVIPDFVKGAGGHTTIFRFVKYLEDRGHRQTIWVQAPTTNFNGESRFRDIQSWYQPLKNVNVALLPTDVSGISGDVVIATDCWTAFPVSGMQFFMERFYFIQDFEPQFSAMGEAYLTAEASYGFGFYAICAGVWLEKMALSYGMKAVSWSLAADKNVYHPPLKREFASKEPLKIAFYARANTSRRCVDMGLHALNRLSQLGYNFEVSLYGQVDLDTSQCRFDFENLGILNESELLDLYQKSDFGMVFSSTNYSLIPLEMMATGLPVVELAVPSINAIFPDDVLMKSEPTSLGVLKALITLIENPDQRQKLSEKGLAFASQFSWEKSFKIVEDAIQSRLVEKGFKAISHQVLSAPIKAKKLATIAIPTYNAGPKFDKVLSIISNQETEHPYEILIIDSGSTDETIDLVRKYPKIRLHEIDNSEFHHARTRNLCIDMSESEFTAFLTQDATPANKSWLANLIHPFSYSEKVVGVFGRHKAYPHHDFFVQRQIERQFDFFNNQSSIFHWETKLPKHIIRGSKEWRLLMAFYSDNNSAMRKTFWREVPYPDVGWGEDQVWADEIIRMGFSKAYADDAVVYHSHSYDKNSSSNIARHEHDLFFDNFGHHFARNSDEVYNQILSEIRSAKAIARKYSLSEEVLNQRIRGIVTEGIGRNYSLFE